MRKHYIVIAVLAIAVLALAACGGGDKSAGNTGADAGKKLFEQSVLESQPGCSLCHSLEPDNVIVGPSLAGIATHAGTAVAGMTAEEYLRQSIVDPGAHVVEGFQAGTMPDVWSDALTEEQINNLVAFLMTLK